MSYYDDSELRDYCNYTTKKLFFQGIKRMEKQYKRKISIKSRARTYGVYHFDSVYQWYGIIMDQYISHQMTLSIKLITPYNPP